MNPTADELAEWDQHHYWHAFTQMAEYQSLVIERAEGVWLYDTRGNRYLDGVSSMWCNLLGHSHPRINDAIREQLDRVAHSTSLGMGNDRATLLAKRLADIAPGDLQHVFFGSDGSSAVEVALKMAFQYWRQCPEPLPAKTRFVALGQAYHGDTLGSASVGGIERFHAIFEPLLFDVIRLSTPDPRAIETQAAAESSAAKHYLAELEQVLATHHEQIAAVVLEPLVQAAAGMVFHPPGYLRGVRELTRKHNVLLILDEIVTGFGRTGRMFACEHEDVAPDVLCLGKSITGGYLPLSATITTPEVYGAFLGPAVSGRSFLHGHTYGGNPLAATAALATLDLLEEEPISDRVALRAKQLAAILTEIREHPHVAETRQLGMIAAVELTPDPEYPRSRFPSEQMIATKICRRALERGVWIRPLRDTLVIMPPLSISTEELEFLGQVLQESIRVESRESRVNIQK